MVKLIDIFPPSHILESFSDADISILALGYDIIELKTIITNKVSYNIFLSYMLDVLNLDDLSYYDGEKLYGYDPLYLINDGIETIPTLRRLAIKYPFHITKLVSLSRKLDMGIGGLDLLLGSNYLFAEVCNRILRGTRLEPLKGYMSKHMYNFNAEYIKSNIEAYKYLIHLPYPEGIISPDPLTFKTPYVNEIDMMKKMYGIPFMNCNTKHIQTCYKKIIDGGLTLTLLVMGPTQGTSDITYDEYYDDELIFLLWNKGKFRPYNIPDLMACTNIEDKTIKLVDPDGDIIQDIQYISKIIKPRLSPYITDEIRKVYSNVDKTKIDPNDVYPMIISILDVVEYIISINNLPKTLVDYINVNKESSREYVLDMYHMALYFRRWKGPGNALPYKNKDADNINVNPEVLCSSLIYKYRRLLKDDDMFKNFLNVCPSYKDNTIVPQCSSIKKLFTNTINGNECIRVASNRFLYTSHRIYTTVFGKLECDINRFENITLVAPEEIR